MTEQHQTTTTRRACAPGALRLVVPLLVLLSPATSPAQRVQIPNTAPAFDPYALGQPPATTLPYAYPQQATVIPPSQPLAVGQPYSIAPPAPLFGAPATAAPPAPAGSLFSGPVLPSGPSLGWQSGTYEWQRNDTTAATFTKLIQQLSIEHAYLWGDTTDPTDLELNETEVTATFAYPLGANAETPLLVTPGFAFNFFNGPIADPAAAPRGPDIPGALYDAYIDAGWAPHPLPAFTADLGLRVGAYTDFDFVSSDSIRVLGRGLGVVHVTPTLDVVAGVVYLDRVDISLLPAGGFHFRPNELWDFYAVFPSPRVTRRLQPKNNLLVNWFVAGEYGGGSWTADRAGLNDRFDYNDLRVTTGVDWETPDHRRGSFEIGYVFDRELVFDSGMPPPASVDDTFIIRLGIDL